MLGEHIKPPQSLPLPVDLAICNGCPCSFTLEYFKPVRGHQNSPASLVHPVICSPNPLHQTGRALWRSHLNYLVDITPVDAEIERRRADQRPELATYHCRLDLPALLFRQRAMVQRNGKPVCIDRPKVLKQHFSLRTRINKDQARFGRLQPPIDIGHGKTPRMAGPGNSLIW
ncbi:MAG: Uncharacterised protein [Hyphomonas sp. TMED17]|nr:MAG: Uncharacterised protein [Hyphomonas sp. TMED17]